MIGILVVSFGTTLEQARVKNIVAVEQNVAALGYPTYSAYTSGVVRNRLAQSGILVNDISSALAKMQFDGVSDVVILPTHVVYSKEYEKIIAQTQGRKFNTIKIAKPLLHGETDIQLVLRALHHAAALAEGEALVLMGHGAQNTSNLVYSAMNFIAQVEGFADTYICTLDAYPSFADAQCWLAQRGYQKAVLMPLLFVSGKHTACDMVSRENQESLASVLARAGIVCRSVQKGLGEYPEIAAHYITHLKECL